MSQTISEICQNLLLRQKNEPQEANSQIQIYGKNGTICKAISIVEIIKRNSNL